MYRTQLDKSGTNSVVYLKLVNVLFVAVDAILRALLVMFQKLCTNEEWIILSKWHQKHME